MELVYKYLVDSVNQKKLDRQTAIEVIKLLKAEEEAAVQDIAIIGMAARLPSARDVHEYWDNIKNGLDCITAFPQSRADDITAYLASTGVPLEEIAYNQSAYLDEIDKFDYPFFNLSPKEASLMDPCQRMFLEVAWQTLEDAGYGGKRLMGSRTGVYVGYANNLRDMYARLILDTDPEALSISMIGNLTAITPSRISYLLDLKGPSMVIDTACSSALVSIDLACQAIRNGSCDTAIAGGININTIPLDKEFLRIGIESSDGRTRAFDDASDGSGIGEGVGAVLLKPLKQAIQDGDYLYAVVKGSASNQDGRAAGITAPNPQAQTDVLIQAWKNAGVEPASLSYIETHGTGTNLGDPIEVRGIHSAFRKFTEKKQFCAISSVKSNIGHLCEAAGIGSLMKAVMALQHKELPPSIYFNKPNRAIAFEDSPVYINTKARPWETDGQARRCGVSAFGISGTNCHVVLEEAPMPRAEESHAGEPGLQLFTLSAKDPEVYANLIQAYIEYLAQHPTVSLDRVCYTANTGRGHYEYRLAALASSVDELAAKLRQAASGTADTFVYSGRHRVVDAKKSSREEHDLTEAEREERTKEAHEKAREYRVGSLGDEPVLRGLAALYVAGADVDWELLAGDEKPKKLPLPVYPFKRERCWLDLPSPAAIAVEPTLNHSTYEMGWVEEALSVADRNRSKGAVMLLKAPGSLPMVQELAELLRQEGRRVLEVDLAASYERTGPDAYRIRCCEQDFDRLLEELAEESVNHVIHATTLRQHKEIESLKDLEESQETGVYSLFYLTRSMLKHERTQETMRIHLLTAHVHPIREREDRLQPENATLIGLGKVVYQEYPHLQCKAMDLDDSTGARDILPELFTNAKTYQSAYRDGKRYVEVFREVNVEQAEPRELEWKPSGVYVITGGMGGIGLEMAKYISASTPVTLALINRTPFPDRGDWNTYLDSGDNERIQTAITCLLEIESKGSRVECIPADVSDLQEMDAVLRSLRERYGRINGVIHGAGIAGAGYVLTKDIAVFTNVMKPKVEGTWILDRLTREDPLDFFVMHSSGVSLIGEAGQGDYVAANSYMDAYASYMNGQGRNSLTVNWVSWKDAGMSVRYGINVDTIFKAITAQQAVTGLEAVMRKKVSRVLIGEINESKEYLTLFPVLPFRLSDRLNAFIHMKLGADLLDGENQVISNGKYDAAMVDNGKLIILPKGKAMQSKPRTAASEILLKGRDNNSYTDTEQQIARIFNEILGHDEIDIYASLFELGGDSVLLMRIHRMVDRLYPGRLKIADLFEFPSVHTLALHLTEGAEGKEQAKVSVEQETREIFTKLEQGTLSLEDAILHIEGL
ncbi:SDR family NAD(P)-dependent oxidoreductase [Gorillibacterium sp. sgz500922]|uniref:SDR family NAD(P)-dependent oxidoreductase n=1 Tax=Gorillibacterium sp. sgz500922 TaxID=3446694 RepID=UPI003F675171